jgi:hypothetical protein
MERVLAVLKKEVGTGGEVETSQLGERPRYGERRGEPNQPILGYSVTNTVELRVAVIKLVGRLLDLGLQAGANTVERVQFKLKDPETAQSEALRAASGKARARAAAMGDGLGLRVGRTISVSEGDRDDSFAPFEEALDETQTGLLRECLPRIRIRRGRGDRDRDLRPRRALKRAQGVTSILFVPTQPVCSSAAVTGAKLQLTSQTPLTACSHPPTVPVRSQGPSDDTWFGWLQLALKLAKDLASKPAHSSQPAPMGDLHETWMFVQPCGPAVV